MCIRMTLDEYLSAAKTESGLTEAQFGARVGLSQPQVNRLRKGAKPSWDTLVRIMAETDGEVTAEDFARSCEAAA